MSYSICLYKPLTPEQFAAVIRSGWREFSMAAAGQKIFYPRLKREHAEMAARMFNLVRYKASYVVEFNVDGLFMCRYEIQSAACDEHKEYKIPVEELHLLNRHIIGEIKVVSAFTMQDSHCQKFSSDLISYH